MFWSSWDELQYGNPKSLANLISHPWFRAHHLSAPSIAICNTSDEPLPRNGFTPTAQDRHPPSRSMKRAISVSVPSTFQFAASQTTSVRGVKREQQRIRSGDRTNPRHRGRSQASVHTRETTHRREGRGLRSPHGAGRHERSRGTAQGCARADSPRRDDAGPRRLRGLPPAQAESAHLANSSHLPHAQVDVRGQEP